MTTLRQAAQQALDALEAITGVTEMDDVVRINCAITALRQALEAEQRYEPVAIVERHGIVADVEWLPASWALRNGDKLYTHPQPAQQPLTEEQIKTAFLNVDLFEEGDELLGYEVDITRAIEAMHGIGGEA